MQAKKTLFYEQLKAKRGDSEELTACIYRLVKNLENKTTSEKHPVMLLGKIQSGKTRCFVGVIAHAFDRQFDVAVVLTKGTKTLSTQTVVRLKNDFKEFIDSDKFIVFDILKQPGNLVKSELDRKLVIVAKKEKNNLRRLIDFFNKYPELKRKRVLLVDDEADLASIRFVRKKNQTDVEQGKIAEKIDFLRSLVSRLAFLQVTATPYSLYLQPEKYVGKNSVFRPKKPAFTELLPIHSRYVGGDHYFANVDKTDHRFYLYVEVPLREQDALRAANQRIKKLQILATPLVAGLVKAITTFILAGCLRNWQRNIADEEEGKYAMIIHNDTKTKAHAWQDKVIEWVIEAITHAAEESPKNLRTLFDAAYVDLSASIHANRGRVPTSGAAFKLFIEALKGGDVVQEQVNKDNDVVALLDDNGELKLRTTFNIFVGGNILDRGITVPKLISFYYGRNPQTMQADTVLQHSRMYGDRDPKDLAVTRLFTSRMVYNRLRTINTFENALRDAFINGTHDKGVVFIKSDRARRIRPCAPNKVMLSRVVTVRPSDLYLPTGFETISGPEMISAQKQLDILISEEVRDTGQFISVGKDTALKIISVIEKTLKNVDADFEWNALRGLIDYYTKVRAPHSGNLLLLAETGRRLSREASGDKSGFSILGGKEIRRLVRDNHRSDLALILIQQEGSKKLKWSGHKFWWPLLALPANVEPCVYAAKVQ